MEEAQSKAYRVLVDSDRYAIIHATDLLNAADILHGEFPEKTLVAQRLSWEDGRRPAGTMKVHQRLYPLIHGSLR